MLMRDSVETELKPCPFCGGEVEIEFANSDYNSPGIHCGGCGAYIVFDYASEKITIKNWNKRIDDE